MGADLSTCQNGHVCECCLSKHSALRTNSVHKVQVNKLPFILEWIANKFRVNGVAYSDTPKWHRQFESTITDTNTMELELGLSSLLGGSTSKDMQVNMNQEWEALAGGAAPLLDVYSLVDEFISALDPCEESAGSSNEAVATSAFGYGDNSIWNSDAATFCGSEACVTLLGQLYEPSGVKNIVATDSTCRVRSCHDSGVSSCGPEFLPLPLDVCNNNDFQSPSPSVPSRFVSAPEEPEGFISELYSPSEGSQSMTHDEADRMLAYLDQLIKNGNQLSGHSEQYDDVSEEFSADADDIAISEVSQFRSEDDLLDSSSASSRAAINNTFVPAPTTGRRRGRKRCVSPSTRRERKRQQNREAAQRYRNRKHGETDQLDVDLESLEIRNRKLRSELLRCQTELSILNRFADRFDVRSLMRQRVAQETSSATGSCSASTSLAAFEKFIDNDKAGNASGVTSRAQNRIITVVHPASRSGCVSTAGSKRNRHAHEFSESQPSSKVARR